MLRTCSSQRHTGSRPAFRPCLLLSFSPTAYTGTFHAPGARGHVGRWVRDHVRREMSGTCALVGVVALSLWCSNDVDSRCGPLPAALNVGRARLPVWSLPQTESVPLVINYVTLHNLPKVKWLSPLSCNAAASTVLPLCRRADRCLGGRVLLWRHHVVRQRTVELTLSRTEFIR